MKHIGAKLLLVYLFSSPGRYVIQNNGDTEIHFHWGLDDRAGSEHAIDGQRVQMEMHVVGFRAEYGSFDIAKHNRNGLVVVAFLLKRSNQVNNGVRQIVGMLPIIRRLNMLYTMPPTFSIFSLIPSTIPSYYEYYGSLTTPPCYEVVKFVVVKNMISVTEEQLEKFREVTNLEQDDDRKRDDDNEEKVTGSSDPFFQLNDNSRSLPIIADFSN